MRLTPYAEIVRHRLLPEPGAIAATLGQQVSPEDIVARGTLPGRIVVLDLTAELGLPTERVARTLRVHPGQEVAAQALVARRRGWTLVRREVRAPLAGSVLGVEEGCLLLQAAPQELAVRAHLPGQVSAMLERGVAIRTAGALVQAAWGSGGERSGVLAVMAAAPGDALTWRQVGRRYRGAILVGGTLSDWRVLLRARQFGLAGLVLGSLHPNLRPLCEQLDLPVLVTEGMGQAPMAEPVFALLRQHHGRQAAIAGAMQATGEGRELIIPLPAVQLSRALVTVRRAEVGLRVRLTRSPYLGIVGEIVALPTAPQATEAGSLAEGAEVRLADGRRLFIPWVNLEILG